MKVWRGAVLPAEMGIVFLALLVGCDGIPTPPTPTVIPAGTMTPASLSASTGTATSTPTEAPVRPGTTTTGPPGIDRIVLTATPDRGPAPLTVRFDVEVTGHFGCEGERWDFGEGTPVVYNTYCAVIISPTQTPGGSTATPKIPTATPTVATISRSAAHQYMQPGTYHAQFTLLDRRGEAASNIVTIIVQ